jgi:hypothetical protein
MIKAMIIKPERLAIILEAISFFLVTLDLFGKTRIESLQVKFVTIVESIKVVDIQKRAEAWLSVNAEGTNRLYPYLYSIIFVGLSIGAVHFLSKQGLYWLVWLVIVPLWIAISFRVVRSITFLLLQFLHIIIKISEKILDGSFTFILLLFKRFKLEGAMLIAGAALFVFSKVISFVYAK